MEYYGNLNNKRLMEITKYKWMDVMDSTTEIGYIYDKGMFLDYVLNMYHNGKTDTLVNELKRRRKGIKEMKHPIEWDDRWKGMKRVKRDKVFYYVGEYTELGTIGRYGVFMELPRIDDDDIFTWKYNDKYDTKEAIINGDTFSFEIIVKPNGNAVIDVRYTKCENKHRNNVTLAQIDVYNASNEDILEAIKIWKNNMIQDLQAA